MIVVIIETLLFLSIGFFVTSLLRKALGRVKFDTVEEEAKDLNLQAVRIKTTNIQEYKTNKNGKLNNGN